MIKLYTQITHTQNLSRKLQVKIIPLTHPVLFNDVYNTLFFSSLFKQNKTQTYYFRILLSIFLENHLQNKATVDILSNKFNEIQ